MTTIRSHAYYLESVISPDGLKKVVSALAKKLRKHKDKFDTIAFRGLSGALIGPLLAIRLKKEFLAVRKGEECHSSCKVEGNIGSTNYIIIDDLISTGKTVKTILEKIQEEAENNRWQGIYITPVCVGIVTYYQDQAILDVKRKYFKDEKGLAKDFFLVGYQEA